MTDILHFIVICHLFDWYFRLKAKQMIVKIAVSMKMRQ